MWVSIKVIKLRQMSGITNDPTGTNQVKSKAVIQILSFLAQMCSITKHCTTSSNSSASLASPQPTSSSLSSNVYLLSCLYVVGRHSLVLTDLRRKGACNQGKEGFEVLLRQFGGNSAPSVTCNL